MEKGLSFPQTSLSHVSFNARGFFAFCFCFFFLHKALFSCVPPFNKQCLQVDSGQCAWEAPSPFHAWGWPLFCTESESGWGGDLHPSSPGNSKSPHPARPEEAPSCDSGCCFRGYGGGSRTRFWILSPVCAWGREVAWWRGFRGLLFLSPGILRWWQSLPCPAPQSPVGVVIYVPEGKTPLDRPRWVLLAKQWVRGCWCGEQPRLGLTWHCFTVKGMEELAVNPAPRSCM